MEFINEFENKVRREVKKQLSKKDKIAVALSGGKDSTTILYLLNKWGYNIEGIIIDLGMNHFPPIIRSVKKTCSELGVKLHIISVKQEIGMNMRELQLRVQRKRRISNCFVCGVIKKWLLNKKARELGFNKLVTGHNLDDRVESIIMNLMMNNKNQSYNLISNYENELFVKRVKPLNNVLEDDIKKYAKIMKLRVAYEPCPYSTNAFRREVMNLINDFEKKHPGIKENTSKYFNKIMKNKEVITKKLRKCNECGEPTINEVCNACQLIKH